MAISVWEQSTYYAPKDVVIIGCGFVGLWTAYELIHKNPKLNIERISEIRKASGVPLVLHGGSGTSDEDFQSAIKAGISTIHINTEIRIAFVEALKKSLKENKKEIAPYKIMQPTIEAIKDVVLSRMKLFNFIK